MSKRSVIVIGKRFGKLVILKKDGDIDGHRAVKCRCDCGTEKRIRFFSIHRGDTKSCGCLAREMAGDRARTHGLSRAPEHKVWDSMIQRCSNPKNAGFARYGGNGIRVCQRWLVFENFFKDMGSRPKGYSIDRIDNEKGYEPNNCRWVTIHEQQRNRKSNRIVEYSGKRLVLKAWAEEMNIPYTALHRRLRLGWSFEMAVTRPLKPDHRRGKAKPKIKYTRYATT